MSHVIGFGGSGDVVSCAAQTDEIWPEALEVIRHDLRGVPLRIERDEDRDHLLRLVAKLVERLRDDLQLSRTNVRAMGKAEEHEHVAAAEVTVGDRLAIDAGEGEGSADKRAARRFDWLVARRRGDEQNG